MFPHDAGMTLLERTQSLLQEALAAGFNARQIAEGSDGAVNYEWLKKFVAEKIDDPGVSRIQSLHDRLADMKRLRENEAA